MKKRYVALSGVAVLVGAVVATTGTAQAATVYGWVNLPATSTLPVRSAPSSTATQVGTIKGQTSVTVLCYELNGTTAWDKLGTARYVPQANLWLSEPAPRCTVTTPTTTATATPTATVVPSPTATTAPPASTGFVTRVGTQLRLNGLPYQFVGYNAFGITGCEGTPWTRTQMDNYFAELPPNSMTRFWATEKYGSAVIDQLVASAQAHSQKIIPTLNNDFADCVSDGHKDNSWYGGGYKNGSYLPWVRTLATKYKNSPAIGMWEPINEAGASSGNLSGTTMKAFYEDFARTVRAIDPNHLIGTGDDNDVYAGGNSAYMTASSAVGIDVLSIHDYASDYGQYWDGNKDPSVMSPMFSRVYPEAQQLNKAVIIGEMNDSGCAISRTQRANQVTTSIRAYLQAGAVGVLVWNRSMSYYNFCPNGEDFIIVPGDPLRDAISHWTF